MIKKIAKTALHYSLIGAKKIVHKSPRLKSALQKSILPHIKQNNKSSYDLWVDNNLPDFIEIARLRKEQEKFTYLPTISVIVPTYNTDMAFLHDCIGSVLGQVYENWELCIVDDASPNEEVRDVIREYAALDDRIKYKFLKKNQHIAGATNEAIAISSGEFISLFDHDDLLWPNALYEVVKALNNDKTIDFIYTDEDKITSNTKNHIGPFFKPDWNPDFLHSVNYITHFSTVRRTFLDRIGGGPRSEYNGAQDWELFLRVARNTNRIHHIPKVVYSWRIHELSTAMSTDSKPYVVNAQRKALKEDLKEKGYSDALVEQDIEHKGYWRVTYPIKGRPLISIVIPTKNQHKIVKRCVDSILAKTTYDNYEIILVDTGSTDRRVLSWYAGLTKKYQNIQVVDWPEQPFSYARSCNKGAEISKGELLVMLNNDTEVITPEWLDLLAGDAQRSEVGAVGPLLFFPDGYNIQHAGVGVGLGGVAANSFSMMTLTQPLTQTQHLMLNTRHNMTAVTAACLMLRRSVYDEVGGFDEEFRVTYNDVDLCLKLRERGYQNIYTPYVQLLHHESISVGLPEEVAKRDTKEMKEAMKLFIGRWSKYVEYDPNINPNLDKTNAFYDLPQPVAHKE